MSGWDRNNVFLRVFTYKQLKVLELHFMEVKFRIISTRMTLDCTDNLNVGLTINKFIECLSMESMKKEGD